MSLNTVIYTYEADEEYNHFSCIQTPTKITLEIDKAEDKIGRYKEYIRSLVWSERDKNLHIEKLDKFISEAEKDGLTIHVELI